MLAKHLALLNQRLLDVASGKISRLLITMPPRHGKSEFASKYFPAWYLGKWPEKKVILASYGAKFASQWGRKVRDLIEEFGPRLFGVAIRHNTKAADEWEIESHKGGMQTCGVGGPLTGKGADCLFAGTMVQTDIGDIEISRLVKLKDRPRIRTYDHAAESVAWQRVVATREVRADECYEIETTGGRRIRATGNHRFYVCERGYRQASLLAIGDRLLVQPIKIQSSMCSVQGAQEGPWSDVPEVLSKSTQGDDGFGMRMVQGAIREAPLRIREGISEDRSSRILLRAGMCQKTSGDQRCEEMPSVQTSDAWQEKSEVLLEGMSKVLPTDKVEAIRDSMPNLQSRVYPSVIPPNLLREGMREQRPFNTDDRVGKFALQGWEKLRSLVQPYENPNFGSRWMGLRDMPRERDIHSKEVAREHSVSIKSCCPPCERERERELIFESSDNVQALSCDSPQIEYDTISMVRRLCSPDDRVYDIQVEGNSNFFANEILVHNCLIIDDPIKNSEEANSEVYRDKTWDWYTSTAYTRLEPGGAVILIQTRWHEDDLAGRIVDRAKETGETWITVNLPAIAGDDDELGRSCGDALWPERYDLPALELRRRVLGSYQFSALYGQSPVPDEGGLFKRSWFRYWSSIPGYYMLGGPDGRSVRIDRCRRFGTVDLAFSLKKEADYTVIGAWAVTPQCDLIMLDLHRERMDAPRLQPSIRAMVERWDLDYIGIERVLGQSLVVHGARLDGLTVRSLIADVDKVTRSIPAQVRMENGQIFFPSGHVELEAIEKELLTFPRGTHDDIVDVVSYAAAEVQRFGAPAETDEDRTEREKNEKEAEHRARLEQDELSRADITDDKWWQG